MDPYLLPPTYTISEFDRWSIPFLVGIVTGYIVACLTGIVDFTAVGDATFFNLPKFIIPFKDYALNFGVILTIAPVALVTLCEHIGDHTSLSNIIGKDLIKDPGLDRTLLGDGIATFVAGALGGPANTTYGENTGVLELSQVFSPRVVELAALFGIVLGFFPKVSMILGTMPASIIGGISFILYGMISAIGVRNMFENNVDLKKSRNLIIVATILVTGLGFTNGLTFNIGSISITLTSLALASLIGILLNAILPGNDYEFGSNKSGDINRGLNFNNIDEI